MRQVPGSTPLKIRNFVVVVVANLAYQIDMNHRPTLSLPGLSPHFTLTRRSVPRERIA